MRTGVACDATAKVLLRLPYETEMGERVWVVGSESQMGFWKEHNACKMHWSAGHVWTAELELQTG